MQATTRGEASGFAVYRDLTHTVGSPQALTASTRAQWTNDAGSVTDTWLPAGRDPLWVSNKIEAAGAGQHFTIRIDFTIDPAGPNARVEVDLDIGSDPFGASSVLIVEDAYPLLKGATVHRVSRTVAIYAGANFATNGCAIGITCSQDADLYAKVITIIRHE